MAHYYLFPESDATIYSQPDRKTLNTGNDEILELVKERGTTNNVLYPSRILLKFNNEQIKEVIRDIIGHSTFADDKTKVNLELTSIEAGNLVEVLNIFTHTVSQSWNEGTGRWANLPTSSNGVSWVHRDNSTVTTNWLTGSLKTIPSASSYASSSILINPELPSGSNHQLTINNVDFVPVDSASLFNSNNSEVFVTIADTVDNFGINLQNAINVSSSITFVTASYNTTTNELHLSGSTSGSSGNVTITTSSVEGNNQFIFSASSDFGHIYHTTGALDTTSGLSFANGTTGSINSDLITKGGGVWYTGSEFFNTQQFLPGDPLDIYTEVTTIVHKWSASLFNDSAFPVGVENHGFLIKKPESIETNVSHSFGYLKYFSVDTHTIYPPTLTFKWDDSSFPDSYTGGLGSAGTTELDVSLYNIKKEYNQNDVAKMKIHVREKYPQRQFASSSNYLTNLYFATSSHYSIRDAHTEEEIIPFSHDYTKLSAQDDCMYFKIYMNGLQPERYYRVLFRHIDLQGNTTVYDDNYYFKVVR